MSFFSNAKTVRPGRIDNTSHGGPRHRVAICVQRVLDSSMKQEKCENVKLRLVQPSQPRGRNRQRDTNDSVETNDNHEQFKFISAQSSQLHASVEDLNITRIEDRPAFARVRCTVVIPLTVKYRDERGKIHTANSETSTRQDVILYVPQPSMLPFEIKATAAVNCPTGHFTSADTVVVTSCLTTILKVVAETDLLVPSYGYMPIPQAIEYEKNECRDYFDLPLYPSGK